MTDSLTLYRQIADRERRSRKVAEGLLEEKSLVLSEQVSAFEKQVVEYEALNSILSNVMLASPDSIITCGPDFKISGVNKTTEGWFGKTEQALIGIPIGSLLPIGNILETWPVPGEIYVERIEIGASEGETFPVEIRGNIGMRGDERCHVVLFIHDITRREQNQKEREQLLSRINESRRLEAIGTLSSGIAHEINTPLQFIGDNIHFIAEALRKIHVSYTKCAEMKRHVKAYPELNVLVREMEAFNDSIRHDDLIVEIQGAMSDTISGINDVKEIIQVMREFVHSGAGRQSDVAINDLISNAVKLCGSRFKNGSKLVWNPCPDLPKISCHRGQIQQVFVNLLMNALDALDEFEPDRPTVTIITQADSTYLHITIADSGPGIPEQIRDKIFDPFFTSKAEGKGTGQGLALAKDIIVNRSNGQLELIALKEFKTAFKISLPLN